MNGSSPFYSALVAMVLFGFLSLAAWLIHLVVKAIKRGK